ncbi:MAG: hypothetical protein ACI4ML_07410 [Aristaeellaceae bacterium]
MRKHLALLCVLALVVQLVMPGFMHTAHAEEASTPSDIEHVHSWYMTYDADKHWEACDCGETQNEEVHYDSCYEMGQCAVCGAMGVNIDHVQEHSYTDYFYHDDGGHWVLCTRCGLDGSYE